MKKLPVIALSLALSISLFYNFSNWGRDGRGPTNGRITAILKKSNFLRDLDDVNARDRNLKVTEWPDLPEIFTKGRTATEDDVKSGAAAFPSTGDFEFDPLDIQIPQYAIYTGDDSQPIHVIVIQAEKIKNGDGELNLYGVRPFGEEYTFVASEAEISLLGTKIVN